MIGVLPGAGAGPFEGRLERDLVRAYGAATRDPSEAVQRGECVPPVAIVTQVWKAQEAGHAAAVPAELHQAATGGVHGEHDVVLLRSIAPGEPLRTWVEGHGARPVGRNSLVTLRYLTYDADDMLVAEQWWSTVYFGVQADAVGDPPPDHAFPETARAHPVGTYEIDVDEDMARRYADVSGDWSAHHFDVAAARRSGFERTFLHGLCTMALCSQGIAALVANGDPARVRRVAVRFATPMFLGERLCVAVYDAGPLGYAFEATSAGATVISNGRAELFSAP